MSDIHFFNYDTAVRSLASMCKSLGAIPAYRSLGNGTMQILCVEDATAIAAFESEKKAMELALGLGLGLGIPFGLFFLLSVVPWIIRKIGEHRMRQVVQQLIIAPVTTAPPADAV